MAVSKEEMDSRPVPDPTNLTTQQLHIAVNNLREIMEIRFQGMDKAVVLLQDYANRVPTIGEINNLHGAKIENLEKRLDHKYVESAAEIEHVREIQDAHLSKIDQQFRDQTSSTALALTAADKAIANAFTAAEKAVAKAELAAEKGYLEAQISALKEAFGVQIKSQKDAVDAALAASDKAVQKAEVANEKRFESVNEFRATLADQQRDLATKSEVNLRFKSLEDRINAVVEDARELKGKSLGAVAAREVQIDNRGLIFGIIGALIGIGALIMTIVVNVIRVGN